MPGPYEIPKSGPSGALLAAMDRHAWRPAHLHIKVQHPGYRPLTTQLFLENDPWLESDVVVGAVKDALIVGPVRHDEPNDVHRKNSGGPYYTLSYDFALELGVAKAA